MMLGVKRLCSLGLRESLGGTVVASTCQRRGQSVHGKVVERHLAAVPLLVAPEENVLLAQLYEERTRAKEEYGYWGRGDSS